MIDDPTDDQDAEEFGREYKRVIDGLLIFALVSLSLLALYLHFYGQV